MNRTQDTWDHLLVLLGEMHVVFEEFMVFLCEEERMLLGMDRQGVATVTEKKEQVLDVMCRYEQQVKVVLHQLAGPDQQKRLGPWLQEARQPQASSANLILHELSTLTRTIQEQGKKNEVLIGRTQHVVREAINIIYTGLGTGPMYGGSGTLHFPSVPTSVHLHG